MPQHTSLAERLMHRMGKLRAVFGPAAIADLNAPINEPTAEQRRQHADHMAGFEVKKFPNGQVYLVAKDPSNGSNQR